MNGQAKKIQMNFKTMAQLDIPQGRNGKHKTVITKILSDLDQLPAGAALKVPLAGLAESKEKVRSRSIAPYTRANGMLQPLATTPSCTSGMRASSDVGLPA